MTKYYTSALKSRIWTGKNRWNMKTWNYLSEEKKHNNLISEIYQKTCKYTNYTEHFLILI